MSMIDAVKRLFTSRKPSNEEASQEPAKRRQAEGNAYDISVDAEVNFIKTLLERKFNRKFQARVRFEGYLDKESDMKYTLVVDDFCDDDSLFDRHSIFGYSTDNILEVRQAFLKAYWSNVEEGINSVGKQLSGWDTERTKKYREMTIAKSREELLIKAELEGVA